MDPRAEPSGQLLRLNRRLLLNCLDDVTEAQAAARVVPGVNSVAFVVAHVIDARHMLLRLLGGSAANPLADVLSHATSIDDVRELPSLEALRAAWCDVDDALAEQLAGLTADVLDGPSPQRYPGVDRTLLGALTFLLQHDSYHIGQVAMLRRALGLPAMRYAPRRPANPAS